MLLGSGSIQKYESAKTTAFLNKNDMIMANQFSSRGSFEIPF
jgi:hypothetical protein